MDDALYFSNRVNSSIYLEDEQLNVASKYSHTRCHNSNAIMISELELQYCIMYLCTLI